MTQKCEDPASASYCAEAGPELSLLCGGNNPENTLSALETQAKIIAARYRLPPHHARLVAFLAFGGGAK